MELKNPTGYSEDAYYFRLSWAFKFGAEGVGFNISKSERYLRQSSEQRGRHGLIFQGNGVVPYHLYVWMWIFVHLADWS